MAMNEPSFSIETILPWISAIGALVIIGNAIWPHLRAIGRWSISKWRRFRDHRRALRRIAAEQREKDTRRKLLSDTCEALTRLHEMKQRSVEAFHHTEWQRQNDTCKHLLVDVLVTAGIDIHSGGWRHPPHNINTATGMWMILWGPSRHDYNSIVIAVRWWPPEAAELHDSTLVLRQTLNDDDLQRTGWTPFREWADGDSRWQL